MQVVYHDDFLKSAARLPKSQQKKLANLIELMVANPYHPLLHTKRLTGELLGTLSFRITRDWRVIFQFLDPQKVYLLRVRHRKDSYR